MKLNKNRIVSLFLILFGIGIIYLSTQIKSLFSLSPRDVGPSFFPIAASIGLVVCAIGKFLTEGKKNEHFLDSDGWLRVIMMFVVLGLYLVAMIYLGYIISTLAASPAMVLVMREERKIHPISLGLFSVGITAVLFLVFQYVIQVSLPVGILFK